MLLLIVVTSIVDLLGLAIFIPILSAVADASQLTGDHILARIKLWTAIEDNNRFLFVLFLSGFVFFLLRSLFIVASQYLQARFVFKVSEYIGEKVYRYYLSSSYEDFSQLDASNIIRELTISPHHFARFLVMPTLLLSSELLMIGLIVAGIAIYNINVFLLLVGTIFPAVFLFQLAVKKKMRKYGRIQHEYTPHLYMQSNRGIHGFVDVILRNKVNNLINGYLSAFRVLNSVNIKTSVLSIIPAKLFEVVTIGGLLLVFFYATFLAQNPSLVLPLITLYAAAGYRIIPSLSKVMPALMQLEQYSYLFEVYNDALTSNKSQENAIHARQVPVTYEKEIAAVGMTFAFKSGATPLFENINIRIRKGEIVGLIGRSGSGKTTLVKLLTGFYKPQAGKIQIDGKELLPENLISWRNQVSYVQQSPYLEKGNLTTNIAFLEDEVDEDRLNYAIASSSLKDFVGKRKPSEVFIDEGGKNLSGGQRQRVIIARALYHQSKLIVLDEATSALDNETENEINQTIESLKTTGVTLLIIAHRYSTLKHTDRIFHMKSGSVIEELRYSELKVE